MLPIRSVVLGLMVLSILLPFDASAAYRRRHRQCRYTAPPAVSTAPAASAVSRRDGIAGALPDRMKALFKRINDSLRASAGELTDFDIEEVRVSVEAEIGIEGGPGFVSGKLGRTRTFEFVLHPKKDPKADAKE